MYVCMYTFWIEFLFLALIDGRCAAVFCISFEDGCP